MQDCKFTFSFIINWPSIISEPRSCCQSRRVWKHGEPKLKTKTRTWPTEVWEHGQPKLKNLLSKQVSSSEAKWGRISGKYFPALKRIQEFRELQIFWASKHLRVKPNRSQIWQGSGTISLSFESCKSCPVLSFKDLIAVEPIKQFKDSKSTCQLLLLVVCN